MKIVRMSFNNKQTEPISKEISPEWQFMIFRTPAIYRINGREHKVDGNSAIIYSKGFLREIRPATNSGLHYDMLTFSMLPSDKQYIEGMAVPFDTPIKLGSSIVIPDLLRSMNAHSLRKSTNHSEFMELAMRLLFIALSEEYQSIPNDKYESVPRYAELLALREAIYEDPFNNWSAKELSAEMGISLAYFHRLYQAAFGVTNRQDIIESRMLQAAELLRNTDDSISKIAEACGYESDAYFMRQFKKHQGCTPTEFRRRAQIKP